MFRGDFKRTDPTVFDSELRNNTSYGPPLNEFLGHIQEIVPFPSFIFMLSSILIDRACSITTPRNSATIARQDHFLRDRQMNPIAGLMNQQHYASVRFGGSIPDSSIPLVRKRTMMASALRTPFLTDRNVRRIVLVVVLIGIKHVYMSEASERDQEKISVKLVTESEVIRDVLGEEDVGACLVKLEFLEQWVLESLGDMGVVCSENDFADTLRLLNKATQIE